MIKFGQGYASMSAPAKELLNLIFSKKLRRRGNPVTRWMATSNRLTRSQKRPVKESMGCSAGDGN
jgi:phage terminase large subunit-like protein